MMSQTDSDSDFLSCLEKGISTKTHCDSHENKIQEPFLELAISAISLDSQNSFLVRETVLDARKRGDAPSSSEIIYIMRLLQKTNSNDLRQWDHVASIYTNRSKYQLGSKGVIILKFNDTIPIFLKEKSENYFLTSNGIFMLEIAFAVQSNVNDKPKIIGLCAAQIKPLQLYGKRLTLELYKNSKPQGLVFANVSLKGVKWRELDESEIIAQAHSDIHPVIEYTDSEVSKSLIQHTEYLIKCIGGGAIDEDNDEKPTPTIPLDETYTWYQPEQAEEEPEEHIELDSVVSYELPKSLTFPSDRNFTEMFKLRQMQRKLFSKRIHNLLNYENVDTMQYDNFAEAPNDQWSNYVDELLEKAKKRLNIHFDDPQLLSYT